MVNYVQHIEGKGRGVFAGKDYKAGEIIEECHVIIFSEHEIENIEKTNLDNYYYQWGDGFRDGAIALGNGSIYNHSIEPNAHYFHNIKMSMMVYKSIRDIKKGEEITVNYNGEIEDKQPVWFEANYKKGK